MVQLLISMLRGSDDIRGELDKWISGWNWVVRVDKTVLMGYDILNTSDKKSP